MSDLKPCPLCGNKDVFLDHLGGDPVWGWFVECGACGLSLYANNRQDQARAKWNRRAPPHPKQGGA